MERIPASHGALRVVFRFCAVVNAHGVEFERCVCRSYHVALPLLLQIADRRVQFVQGRLRLFPPVFEPPDVGIEARFTRLELPNFSE